MAVTKKTDREVFQAASTKSTGSKVSGGSHNLARILDQYLLIIKGLMEPC